MNSKERTSRTIEFRYPDQIPICTEIFEENEYNKECSMKIKSSFSSDILMVSNYDIKHYTENGGIDDWGCVWKNLGYTIGEVVGHPLCKWEEFESWKKRIPDYKDERRYKVAKQERKKNFGKFIIGELGLLQANLLNLRGFTNFMTDLYLERNKLNNLIDIIYNAARDSINKYSEIGIDAVIVFEDWGLQDRLMIKPDLWRMIFKEKMSKVVDYTHRKNLKFILHSCGNILDIIDDFIEIGIDVLQIDQQRNMGLDNLAKYAGKICFFCPADIQFMSNNINFESIEKYCSDMISKLSIASGGFMYITYARPKSVGIRCEAIYRECKIFSENNPYC